MPNSTTWNPASYSKNARFVSDLGEPVLQLLAPRAGELVLDLGCGDGALTEKIAAAGCQVIGVDSSAAQIGAARRRRLNAAVMNGHQLAFTRVFDAVFSNAALHWMKQPDKVVAGVAKSLKPGGRFVGEFGGKGNVEAIRSALHGALSKRGIDPWTVDPWYYPSPEEYLELLEIHGLRVEYIELIPRPTKLPGDILGWLETFAQPFTNSIAAVERSDYLAEVKSALEPNLRDTEGAWTADYVRLRFKALRNQ
jgi:trans-aconitate methyltransferase